MAKGKRVYLADFSFSRSVPLKDVNAKVKALKKKGFKDFEIGIDFGYYEGEEEIALYGYKDEE